MVIRSFIIFLIYFISLSSLAQKDSTFRFIKTIKINVESIAVDNLDNLYVLTSTYQLKKFNSNGDSLSVYNNVKQFGQLHSIDVSNPLKLILFYKDFSTIVTLDRLLTIRSIIDLRKQNILQPGSVALSYDNNVWVFDEYDSKLKKIGEDGKLIFESSDFRMLFQQPVLPQQVTDHNGLLYLYDVNNGLFVFDHYGTFKRKIPITKWQNIFISDKYISGLYNNSILFYNTSTLIQQKVNLPASPGAFTNYIIANTKLFTLAKDSLNIYSYKF